MPQKPKGSSVRFVHGGWVRAEDQAERHSWCATGEYSCTTPCWSQGGEEARLVERPLSVHLSMNKKL